MRNGHSSRSVQKFILHPLIHTRLEFNLAQDMVSCQRGEKEAPADQSSSQGQWGPSLKGHQGEADEEYHRGPRPLGFLP
jgi:hypothetical protein